METTMCCMMHHVSLENNQQMPLLMHSVWFDCTRPNFFALDNTANLEAPDDLISHDISLQYVYLV